MGKKRCHWTIILLSIIISLLLSSCAMDNLRVYTIAQEEDEQWLLIHEDMLSEYDTATETILKTTLNIDKRKPIRTLWAENAVYAISYIDLNQYTGSYEDAINYTCKLIYEGFSYIVSKHNGSTLDVLLTKDVETIRVLWLGSSTIRIFYKNIENKIHFPPYIHE